MELKQLAESITMIAYKKKLTNVRHAKFRNRPLLWAERMNINSEVRIQKPYPRQKQ